jgi:putative membrane protein
MRHFLTRVIVTAFSLILVAEFVPGIHIVSLRTVLLAAFLLGLINMLVRPILLFLTFPITLLTLGLFIFVINAALFGLVAFWIPGFAVDGFIPALIGSCIVSIVSTLVHSKNSDA